jgi:hypothetical protein
VSSDRLRLLAVLLATFLLFLFLPAYMALLRHQAARAEPQEWATVTNNGPFTYISPLQVSTIATEENGYAAKLRQIGRRGLPLDPYSRDRSIGSWLFDSLLFFPLAPLLWLSGGNIQVAWILAHAIFGTVWLWLFYRLFRFYSSDSRYALLFATACLYFIDTLMFFTFKVVLDSLARPGGLAGNLTPLVETTTSGPVQFIRVPTPALSFLWLGLALWGCVALATNSRRRLGAAAGLGFSLGLLSLAHFYEWTIGVMIAGLLWLYSLTAPVGRHNRWNLTAIVAVAGAVSGGYYFVARHLTRDIMHDVIDRMGKFGMNLRSDSLLYLLLAAIAWWMGRRVKDRRRWVWVVGTAVFLAVFALTNFSLVLGYDIQFFHARVVANLAAVLLLLCWLIDRKWLKDRLLVHAGVIIIAILAWVALREKAWGDKHYRLYGVPRDVASAMNWVNTHLEDGTMMVSLSQPIVELLALQADVQFPFTCGIPNFARAVSTESNTRGFARMLSSLDADVDHFLAERWTPRQGGIHNATHFRGDLDWPALQKESWRYFMMAWKSLPGNKDEESRMIREFAAREAPLERPYYLWLQSDDREFLRRSPEELGGELAYQNGAVAIYAFR